MGNIIGESFPKQIRDQINVRQRIYGSGWNQNRTPEELIYLNNNTAWCKLVSATEIDSINQLNNPIIQKFKLGGSDLAKNFVLFNGTSTIDDQGKMTQRGGVDTGNTLGGQQHAYGIGGSSDFGIRPMMGIESVKVQHKNRGSIRTAQVNIKAWNKTQFEIIDVLYMRVGFSVLLEWGNTMYFNNDGGLEQAGLNNSLALDFFNNSDYDTMLNKIQRKRLDTFGNYDAMFGKVTNFHWSFMADGSYDITIDLVSIGDVVESFKINAAPSTINTLTSDPNGEAANSTIWKRLTTEKNKHAIAEFLDRELNLIPSVTEGLLFVKDILSHKSKWYDNDGYSITNPKIQKEKTAGPNFDRSYTLDILLVGKSTNTTNLAGGNIASVGPIRPGGILDENGTPALGPGPQAFIRLGYFLEWIQDSLLYRSQGKNSNNKIPILKIDTNPETNIMGILKETPTYDSYGYPVGHIINQMSYDPFVCMVRKELPGFNSVGYYTNELGSIDRLAQTRKFNNGSNNVTYLGSTTIFKTPGEYGLASFTSAEQFDLDIEGKSYGRIMNIYLNFEFILDKMNELLDETTGKISFIDFIKALLEGINGAMGGVNQLDFVVDETSNTGKIIDKNPYPSPDSVLKYFDLQRESVEFQMYGYGNDPIDRKISGFVKDFKLTTELTPEFSTLITVGATANNTVVGEDSTALSKLNKGLFDRYKENINETVVPYNPVVFVPTTPTASSPVANDPNIAFITTGITTGEGISRDPSTIRYDLVVPGSSPYEKKYFRYLLAAFNIDSTFQPSNQPEPNSFYQYLILLKEYGWRREYASTFKSQFQTIYRYWNQFAYESGSAPTFKTGFIPFNLSLTFDGLSGMKIYQKFNVNTDFLPSNYPDSIEFLIKNISHEIKENKWTTNLESFCISKPNSEVKNAFSPNTSGPGIAVDVSIPVEPLPVPDWSAYTGTGAKMRKALVDQSTYIYTNFGEKTGTCAGYTYRIAYNLKEYIDTNSTKAIPISEEPKYSTSNADQDKHRMDILKLGIYDEFYLGAYIATELKAGRIKNNYAWNYGDILNYYAPGYTERDTNMHTQIYTGNIWKDSYYLNTDTGKYITLSNSNTGWSTSAKTNYGAVSGFVYPSDNKVFKVFAYKVKPEYLK